MSIPVRLDSFVEFTDKLTGLIPFSSSTWIVLFILMFFVWLFSVAQRNRDSNFNWEDFFVDDVSNRASPYKLGYMVGLVVGTWVIITFADAGTLTWDIFGGYLVYLLGGAGWVNTLQTKEHNATLSARSLQVNPPPSVNDKDD